MEITSRKWRYQWYGDRINTRMLCS